MTSPTDSGPSADAPPPGDPATAAVARVVWVGLVVVLLVAVAAGVWSLTGGRGPRELPRLGSVPDFALVERSGGTISRSDLADRVWVANFIFTSCGGVCPALSARMVQLRKALGEHGLAVQSVSISVDPTRDTPEVLRAYAERYRADAHDWLFLTGDRPAVYRLIADGFHLSVAERAPEEAADSNELITHSDRFVLVDGAGQIRGYYHGSDADVIEQVVRDAGRLVSPR